MRSTSGNCPRCGLVLTAGAARTLGAGACVRDEEIAVSFLVAPRKRTSCGWPVGGVMEPACSPPRAAHRPPLCIPPMTASRDHQPTCATASAGRAVRHPVLRRRGRAHPADQPAAYPAPSTGSRSRRWVAGFAADKGIVDESSSPQPPSPRHRRLNTSTDTPNTNDPARTTTRRGPYATARPHPQRRRHAHPDRRSAL